RNSRSLGSSANIASICSFRVLPAIVGASLVAWLDSGGLSPYPGVAEVARLPACRAGSLATSATPVRPPLALSACLRTGRGPGNGGATGGSGTVPPIFLKRGMGPALPLGAAVAGAAGNLANLANAPSAAGRGRPKQRRVSATAKPNAEFETRNA